VRLRPRRREFLKRARPFVCHPPYLLNRSLKAHELALQFVDRRFESVAKRSPATRKEEIAGGRPDEGANERPCCNCRSIAHTTSYEGMALPKPVPRLTKAQKLGTREEVKEF
jgi:hypothetical protein